MRESNWRIDVDDGDGDPEFTGAAPALLATVRALADAILRTWRIWVGAAVAGALLALGALSAMPHPATATTTLLMVSPNAGEEGAMTTDMSLLMTRPVAQKVIADLGLRESPEQVLSAVSATPMSNQILTVTVGGPNDAAAVARARSLVKHYLAFRAVQLRSISDGLVKGYDKRVATLRVQVEDLTREYSRLSDAARVNQVRLNDVLTARTTLGTQINGLQQSIEDARLQTEASITSTHLIDEPVADTYGSRRQLILFAASGAILGAAAALAIILFHTLTTDRLRGRQEVASALGVPVRVGVGPVLPRSRAHEAEAALAAWIARHLRGHPRGWSGQQHHRNLEVLAQGVQLALGPRFGSAALAQRSTSARGPGTTPRGGPVTLGVAAVDRVDAAAMVLRGLAEHLALSDVRVLLVDLSGPGALAGSEATGLCEGRGDWWTSPAVFRPEGDPALAAGPRGTDRHPAPPPDQLGDLGAVWGDADVVLALVQIDPGIDLDLLGTWVSRVVPLVSAGRASRDLLAAITAFLEESALEVPFALLEGADRSDRSFGHPARAVDERAAPAKVQAQ